jgi:hypothetical protein
VAVSPKVRAARQEQAGRGVGGVTHVRAARRGAAGPSHRVRHPVQWWITGGAAWPSIVAQNAHWWNPANAAADSGAVAFGISS